MGTRARHLRPVDELRLRASARVDTDERLARQSEAVALMRDWGERMQAERVAVLLDLGDGGAATL